MFYEERVHVIMYMSQQYKSLNDSLDNISLKMIEILKQKFQLFTFHGPSLDVKYYILITNIDLFK